MADEKLLNRRMENSFTTPGVKAEIWRVPSGGGEEISVLEEAQDWALASRGIYFVKNLPMHAIYWFDFSTRSITPIVPTDKGKAGSLSVPSDGRWLL